MTTGAPSSPSLPALQITKAGNMEDLLPVVPSSLQVKLNSAARNSCWVSFDGRHQMELVVGDRLVAAALFGLWLESN